MSIHAPATLWKQAFFIWLGTNIGGCTNFLFAFPNYHLTPTKHWWVLTGIVGTRIAALTLGLVPASYLAFRKLLLFPQRSTRLLVAFGTIVSFTGLAWLAVVWWFSDWISYQDDFSNVALGYFLASLLAHALIYRRRLFLGTHR